MSKVYHIYAKERCIMHNVSEMEFKTVWTTLNNMVDLLNSDYELEDLSYEELDINSENWKEASH